jgi:TrpR-related protein YerC/YecD
MTKKCNEEQKIRALMRAIGCIHNEQEGLDFFMDLCSPSELDAMADRWQVLILLREGVSYRVIQDRTGVSLATITRVARSMNLGNGGYALIADRSDV